MYPKKKQLAALVTLALSGAQLHAQEVSENQTTGADGSDRGFRLQRLTEQISDGKAYVGKQ